jgi:tetratricopeptide (TPR) repeat protein
MAGSTGRRRFRSPQWAGDILYWVERRAERRAQDPQERLELAEKRLAKSVDRHGPDSWKSINAMEAVAKYREGFDRYADALPLREQVHERRRKQLGSNHQLTLAAEARLAVTLIELQRPERAQPLLAHVHQRLSIGGGTNDLTALAVTERLADTESALGNAQAARGLLEEVLAAYQEGGYELLAAGIATKLAKNLIHAGRYPEATELLRQVVEVRSRTLGPEDPETRAALRNLASSLVWTKELAEASIVAGNLLATTVRIQGAEHADTLEAERLVDNINRRLNAG